MTRWSDAYLTLTIPEADMEQASEIHVTVAQGRHVVDIDNPTVIGAHQLEARLNQKQTMVFSTVPEMAQIQVNFMVDGVRRNTEIVNIPVKGNLLEEVIGDE